MPLLSRQAVGSLLAVMVASCVLSAPAQAQMCKLPPTGNPSCASDSTSQSSPNPSTGVGNPIDLTSGNKYQQEIDIEAPGELAIGFRRHYNSMQTGAGVLGKGWSHTYETRLSRTETRGGPGGKGASPPQITLIQGDGRQITFESYEATTTVRRYRSVPAGYGLIEEDVGAITRLRESKALHPTLALDELKVWKWTWPDSRTLTFNGRGLLQTLARPDGRALQVQFDAQRRLSRVTDPSGNWLAAVYWDEAATKLQDFSASGKRGSGYRGRLKELTLSTGERYQYEYDTHGDLSDVVYPDGTVRRYEYDADNGHHLAKIIGRDKKLAASYEYDSTGHAVRSSHPDHQDDVKVRYDWPQDKQTIGHTTVESATGEKTTYTWRSGPQAQSAVILEANGPGCRTCAAGNVRYEYDAHERITKTVRLDTDGEPIEQVASSVDELGRTRTVEVSQYAGNGKPQAPLWRERRQYTGNSLLPTLIVRPSVVPGRDHTLLVEYNEQGQPTRITEKGFRIEERRGAMPVSLDSTPSAPLERVTVLTYRQVNGLSLLASVDGPLPGPADTWTYQYDAAGRLSSVAYPGGLTETFERDTWGRVTGHVGVDAVRETLEYDTNGNITRFARGDSWMTLGYDDAGRIARILDSLGQLLTLTRDRSGELVEIADVAGNRIHWSYGDHGDVKALTLLNPDGSLEQRARPATTDVGPTELAAAIPNEAMLSAIDHALPDEVAAAMPGLAPTSNTGRTFPTATRTAYDQQGRVTTYTYDDFGRLTAEHSPVSGTTRFYWDEADHLIERVAADDSATRITRDALGRAIRVRAGPEDGHIQWGAANRPVRVTYIGGEERFDYDAQARLTSHVLAVDGKEFRITYEFDSLGRLSRKHLPDGSVLRYRYNGPLHPRPGVLAGIYLEGLLERPIATDLNSSDERFANRGFTFGNGLAQRRVLNVDGQVVSDGNPKVGQSHLDGLSATYTHTAGVGSAIPADSLPPLTARLAARMEELGSRSDFHAQTVATPNFVNTPTFDVRGQVVEDSQRNYEWDALGRLIRVSRAEAAPGFHRTSFSATAAPQRVIAEYRYNLFGERIAKLVNGPSGPKLTYFLWDGTELAAEMDERGAVLRDYVYLDSRPIALLCGHSLYAIHTDHRLAPIAVTDSNRRVVWQADVHDNGAADVLPGSELELPLRASNQYFDTETGLHYNLHRYLDAQQGHYLSPDPVGLAAGTDVYQFALGRPHVFVDLLGLQATKTDWSKASYTDKLVEIIKRAVPMVPGEIGAALQQLIQPSNLVVMGAIFTAFAAAQSTPIGWIADAAILGYSAWSLGSGLTVIIDTLLQLNTDTSNAKCDPDLTAAAQRLAAGFVSGTGQVSSGLLGVFGVKSSGGITRIANGITTLVDYAKSALGVTEETALVIQGTTGTVPASPPLTQGLGGTVPNSLAKIVWTTGVSGIKGQGLPFEDYVATQLGANSRLPVNFETWDFFNAKSGVATSAKTLNTLAPGYAKNPAGVYSALTKYLNAMKSFKTATLKGVTVNASQITARELQLAVPAGTSAAVWTEILKAQSDAAAAGMKLIITVVN